jgi:FKBP-type peptidyl-prolyl cis-trans isomerase SlyD
MNIAQNTVVALTYELREGNAQGEIVEVVDPQEPFVFLFGTGGLLPDFENNLSGLKAGDTFEFGIDSDSAYGPFEEGAVVALPLETFIIDGAIDLSILEIGNVIPMRDQNGQLMHGTVVEVDDNTATLDFNHPMAGIDLYFTGTILAVRLASAEELAHGHAHGADGHSGHHH